MKPGLVSTRLAPWSGLFVGATAWFVDQRLGADANIWNCARAGAPWVLATGLVCLAATAVGGVLSWRARPLDTPAEAQTQRFARIVGMVSAAIFALTIAFGMLAGAILPACQR
jgi:hypothetical protein